MQKSREKVACLKAKQALEISGGNLDSHRDFEDKGKDKRNFVISEKEERSIPNCKFEEVSWRTMLGDKKLAKVEISMPFDKKKQVSEDDVLSPTQSTDAMVIDSVLSEYSNSCQKLLNYTETTFSSPQSYNYREDDFIIEKMSPLVKYSELEDDYTYSQIELKFAGEVLSSDDPLKCIHPQCANRRLNIKGKLKPFCSLRCVRGFDYTELMLTQ